VMVNGAASALTCTVNYPSSSCNFNTNVTLAVNDVVNVRAVPNSSPDLRSATWTTTYTFGDAPIR